MGKNANVRRNDGRNARESWSSSNQEGGGMKNK